MPQCQVQHTGTPSETALRGTAWLLPAPAMGLQGVRQMWSKLAHCQWPVNTAAQRRRAKGRG